MPQTTVLNSSSYIRPPLFRTPGNAVVPVLPQKESDGTYFYDGGPRQPMPVPERRTPPTLEPKRPTVPLDGKLVSVPSKAPKYSYPAYGETVQRDPTRLVSRTTDQTVRMAYPAYGER
jgi:hypothetical protein